MPTTIDSLESSVTETLMVGNFPDLDGVAVIGPQGLAPIALAQVIQMDQSAIVDGKQAAAVGRIVILLDKARELSRPLLFAQADTLSGQHRLAQARRATFAAVARLLVQVHAITQEAGIALTVTTGKVHDSECGGYRRGVILCATPARAASRPGLGASHHEKAADISERATANIVPPARGPAPEAVKTATLIATGYLARHPDAAHELPAIVREIFCALQTCGTLPTDLDDVSHFAGRLAKVMASTPQERTRHVRVRRRATDCKVTAGT